MTAFRPLVRLEAPAAGGGPDGADKRETVGRIERALVRDAWNKILPMAEMMVEMFFERLLLDRPHLVERFGPAATQARREFLGLFDLAARSLDPATERHLREGFAAAPGSEDRLCRTQEEFGAFFSTYGLDASDWRAGRDAFVWMVGSAPFLEQMDCDELAKGPDSAHARFFEIHVAEPMLEVASAERAILTPAVVSEMKRDADAMLGAARDVGAFFYRRLFERHPELMPLFGTSDMNALSRHLVQSIAFLANQVDAWEATRGELAELAAIHRARRIPPDAYPKLAAPLIETIEAFRPALSPRARAGWALMLARATQVIAHPAREDFRLLGKAREFLAQMAEECGWPEEALKRRLAGVEHEIVATGTYTHSFEELDFGAKVAWRNAPKCIGRYSWRNMLVRDCRHVEDPDEIFAECVEHLRVASGGGTIETVMTVFRPKRPGERWGPRIWNSQLLRYAGYELEDNGVLGDRANVGLTNAIRRLGWRPPKARGRFDVLPLVIDVPDIGPKVYEIPREVILEVPVAHPSEPKIAELDLRWFAVPAISNFRMEIGGIEYGCLPFNGWFMETEIARNLFEETRYSEALNIAHALGLDVATDATLWRDRAFHELNVAILHSFAENRVTVVDHHTAARQFLAHDAREKRAGRECPAQWSWITPAAGGSTCPTWHHEMREFHLTPTIGYAADRWAVVDRMRPAAADAVPEKANGGALILFASETGTAEDYAWRISRRFGAAASCVASMDTVEPEQLVEESLVLVVCSTFRDGEVPQTGRALLSWLERREPDTLQGLRFAVLGLGNRVYPKFCAAAEAFDRALARAGAERLAAIERADELSGQAETARLWIEMMAKRVSADAPDVSGKGRLAAPLGEFAWVEPPVEASEPAPEAGWAWARLISSEELLRNAKPPRSTRQLVFAAGEAGLTYRTGDHLAIQPTNPVEVVEAMGRRLDVDLDSWFRYDRGAREGGRDGRYARGCSVRALLTRDLDLSLAESPDDLLRAMRDGAELSSERTRLDEWLAALSLDPDAEARRALEARLRADFFTVPELLDAFPAVELDLAGLIEALPRLKPRFYSISSSHRVRPGEIALTVGALSIEMADGRCRLGLCSSMLHRLRPGDRALVSVKAPPRRLPDSPGAPLLLIGAGTGIAPLYAVLEDRAARHEDLLGETALFFGCRNAGEVLYEEDLLRWRREGVLIHFNTAFSRASRRRVLVQDALEAERETVWAALCDPRSVVFVSGDARMADGVLEQLVEIAQSVGKLDALEAVDHLDRMRQEGRYVADVWSVHLHHTEAIGQLRRGRHSRAEHWLQRLQRAGSRVSSRFARS